MKHSDKNLQDLDLKYGFFPQINFSIGPDPKAVKLERGLDLCFGKFSVRGYVMTFLTA